VQFNGDKTASRSIIFHFRSVDKKWKLTTLDKYAASQLPATANMTMVANELLQSRFYDKVKDVDYKLVQVTNKPIKTTSTQATSGETTAGETTAG
jgi:hypothetical protein